MSKTASFGKYPVEFPIPSPEPKVKSSYGGTILFNSNVKINGKIYRWFIGWGQVLKISKGDKLDIVLVKFGERAYNVVATRNHPRRQVMTLKRGYLATVFGYSRVHYVDVKNRKGEPIKAKRTHLYAWGFQGWYVPLIADLRAIGKGDTEELSEKDEELEGMSLEEMDMKEVMR